MYESNVSGQHMCKWVSGVKVPLAIEDEYPAARTAVMGRAAPSCTTHKNRKMYKTSLHMA